MLAPSSHYIITRLLAAWFLYFTAVVTATPVSSFDHGKLRIERPKSDLGSRSGGIAITPSARNMALSKRHDGQSGTQIIYSQSSTEPAATPRSLDRRRGLPQIAGMMYHYLEVNAIDPLVSEFRTIMNDLDTAFENYVRKLESIEADHPPQSHLSLHYGALNLDLECGNPMNLDIVKAVVRLLTYHVHVFGRVCFYRLLFYWGYASAILVAFGALPMLAASQRQQAITGWEMDGRIAAF